MSKDYDFGGVLLAAFAGAILGLFLFFILVDSGNRWPEDACNAGAKDALHGRLNPVIHIEDQDTTITYKLQWP